MHGVEESESAVVLMKEPDDGQPEEALERRVDAKENRDQPCTYPTQSKATVSQG
jgi:hypothetical protein